MRSLFAIAPSRHTVLIAALMAVLPACVKVDKDKTSAEPEVRDSGTHSPDASSLTPATDGGTVPNAEAVADADVQANLPSLMLCGELDKRWGNPDDRLTTWADAIAFSYLIALDGECRIRDLVVPLSEDEQINYVNHMLGWTLEFFGCPSEMTDASTLTYGLTETGTDHVFTTADMDLLSSLFVGALEQAVSEAGADALSEAQLAAIREQLAALASMKSAVVKSDLYTLEACTPSDAGADAGSSTDASVDVDAN